MRLLKNVGQNNSMRADPRMVEVTLRRVRHTVQGLEHPDYRRRVGNNVPWLYRSSADIIEIRSELCCRCQPTSHVTNERNPFEGSVWGLGYPCCCRHG